MIGIVYYMKESLGESQAFKLITAVPSYAPPHLVLLYGWS